MTEQRPTISICIPFYSNVEYLRHGIDSVIAQSVPSWQVLVVDDNMADQGCAELIEAYGDSRITYHKNSENLGLAGNWNRCLDSAKADLVTLLHADDCLHKDYVRIMLEQAEQHPDAAAFFCDAAIIDATGQRIHTVPDVVKSYLTPRESKPYRLAGPQAIARLLKGNFIVCPTLCYRMSRIGSLRFSHTWRMVLDFDFTLRLLVRGEHLVGIPQKLFLYRRHSSNKTNELSQSLVRSKEELSLWQEMERLAAARGWQGVAAVARKKRILKLTLFYWIAQDLRGGRWTKALEKVRFFISMWRSLEIKNPQNVS